MDLFEMNVDLFRTINDFGKEYTYLNNFFIFMAEYMVFVLAFIALIFWFTRREENRMMIISATISFILAEMMGKIAGTLHSNNQPFAELSNVNKLIEKAVDNSFPSDHTILFFAFCMTFFIYQKRWRYIWIMLALVVGISRIWVGVHYPADVIVGAIISIFSTFIASFIVSRLNIIRKLLWLYEKGEQQILPTRDKSREL
ncbi:MULTISPECIES: undecaprenyl-diphosphatase [Priestia]|jgi:undecaprenyl-diphosphatase|uniref:Bacitracin transport permease n=4 Tax=Priestia TaxID=2800373 RepID=D5DNS4_PRIM1|nr:MULTISPECIES: undecaprenyl-diphosphatase [Priestia]KOP73987.1 bacitracin ABC transporter permease [Bacillus sp. FJAT-21351]KQU23404.1 bacitracin ABC transporter permease [Bacillus sp. Leaf75]MCJ7986719.1 undecaprenyl-diphosphatase [Priestia sp. OVL9]MDP9574584.1 undecaprenyl-diphosphatase [Bacillus sp. 1751]ADE68780.1 bacitracin transport permease [Priestia megaterium QM B1551]